MAIIRAALCDTKTGKILNVIIVDDEKLDDIQLEKNQILIESDEADPVDAYDKASAKVKKISGELVGEKL